MKALTRRQSEVLDFIGRFLEQRGMPPTIAEIADGLGVSSAHGIRGHLQALARKGVIELIPGASRGIRLLGDEAADEGLPIVGRVAAGQPVLAAENIEAHCAVGETVFRPQADYLLRVHGTSMRDAGILDGDLLAVHRQPTADNGQIVVARLGDEVTVKRFRRRGDSVDLEPENPDFEVIRLDLKESSLDIEGIAVGVLRQM